MTSFQVFNVKCEHVLQIVVTVEFEQENICWVHIENKNTFESKIMYIMRYFVVLSV